MAKAYECDVCGVLFKREKAPDITIVVRHDYEERHKDLCPECQTELENWLKEKEKRKK